MTITKLTLYGEPTGLARTIPTALTTEEEARRFAREQNERERARRAAKDAENAASLREARAVTPAPLAGHRPTLCAADVYRARAEQAGAERETPTDDRPAPERAEPAASPPRSFAEMARDYYGRGQGTTGPGLIASSARGGRA